MKTKAAKMNQNDKGIKRLTKKDCYKKFGITFENGKILSPIGYIPELLKEGNDKTGKLVYTFSILPGTGEYILTIDGTDYVVTGTCCCDCIGCYAKTGRFNGDVVIHSMAVNTFLVNNYPDFVKNCIMAQLMYIGRGEVRIHAAGDFNTKDPDVYANIWHYIAEKITLSGFGHIQR